MEPTAADERELSREWVAARVNRLPAEGQRITNTRRRLGRHAINALLVGVALLLFLAPVVIFLVALTWAAITAARSLYLLVDLIHAHNFAALGPHLHELNIAMRLALLSAGYFALVSALIVLYAGVLGSRWRRTMLIPGVLLTIPSAIALIVGAALTGAATGLVIQAQVVIFVYVLLDAIALGCLLADTRAPMRRVRRFMRPRRYFLWQRMPYYARRFQARYAVMREALREPEPDHALQPPLPQGEGEPAPSWQPELTPHLPQEDPSLAQGTSAPDMPTVA